MAGFGRDMRGERVGQAVRIEPLQRRDRRRADEAVEQHRELVVRAASVAPMIAASSRPPSAAGDLQRIGERCAMCSARPRLDRRRLALQPGIVDAGAAPDPARRHAAEQRRGDRRRRRGVADAHLAEAEQVGVLVDRVVAGRHGGQEIRLVHRRRHA